MGGDAIKFILTGLAYGGRISPNFWRYRSEFRVEKNLHYTAEKRRSQALDIYTPTKGNGPYPVVFFVHGGGFRILSKDTHWMMAHALVRRGYMVVSINYRMVPSVRFPEPAKDVCTAFEWFVERAEKLGADLSRLTLMGESAGANLSTMLALCLTSERPEPWAQRVRKTGVFPQVLIPQCGMLEVSNIERYKDLPIPTWIADRIVRVANDYLPDEGQSSETELASPLTILEKMEQAPENFPAVFAPVGDADPVVDDTRRLGSALDRLGIRNEIREYPKGGHAFHAFLSTQAAQECWRDTFQFLNKHLPQP